MAVNVYTAVASGSGLVMGVVAGRSYEAAYDVWEAELRAPHFDLSDAYTVTGCVHVVGAVESWLVADTVVDCVSDWSSCNDSSVH